METKQLQIVSFDQAKRLKALGFDWEVYDYINIKYRSGSKISHAQYLMNWNNSENRFSAPSVALALKWARDAGFLGYVSRNPSWSLHHGFTWNICLQSHEMELFDTYEAAESALLDELLTLLEEEEKK